MSIYSITIDYRTRYDGSKASFNCLRGRLSNESYPYNDNNARYDANNIIQNMMKDSQFYPKILENSKPKIRSIVKLNN